MTHTAIPELSLCDMACSSSLSPPCQLFAVEAGARLDNPIIGS